DMTVSIRSILQDRRGEIWVSTDRGLFRFDAKPALAHLNHLRPAARYATTGGLPTDDVTLAFEDSRGDIWIGTREPTTMAVLRRSSNRLEVFSEGEGLPKVTTPIAVTEDLAGNIWIGFREGGLVRYRNGRFELFAEREGLPRSEVLDLFLDHSGR